jgi:hypothetical protein
MVCQRSLQTMLAVPQIADALNDKNDQRFMGRKWAWYIVLTLPLTVFVLLGYIIWEWGYKKPYLKRMLANLRTGVAEKKHEQSYDAPIPLQVQQRGALNRAASIA